MENGLEERGVSTHNAVNPSCQQEAMKTCSFHPFQCHHGITHSGFPELHSSCRDQQIIQIINKQRIIIFFSCLIMFCFHQLEGFNYTKQNI